MATVTMYDIIMNTPTVALWVPKRVDAHPAMVETLGFADSPRGRQVLIRGLGVKKQWVPMSEVRVLPRSKKVHTVSWVDVVGFPKRRG